MKQKQTKRGRLKQEAQHRLGCLFVFVFLWVFFFVFLILQHLDTTGGHACSFGKKNPRQSQKSSNHPSKSL